jgi:hypothetical protein
LDAAEVSVFINIHNKHDSHSFPGILGWRKLSRWDGKGMRHKLEVRDVHTDLWLGSLKERVCLKVFGVDGWMLLKWIVNEWGGKLRSGFVWLRLGTCVDYVRISASKDRLSTKHLCSWYIIVST